MVRDLARVLVATEKKDGCFQGNGYQVTWAVGHLMQLAEPEAYGFEKWQVQDFDAARKIPV